MSIEARNGNQHPAAGPAKVGYDGWMPPECQSCESC